MAIKHYELEDPNVWNVASHNWMVSNIYIDGNRWRCIPYLLQPITRKAPSKGFPPQYLPQLQNTFWSCMLGELTGSGWLLGCLVMWVVTTDRPQVQYHPHVNLLTSQALGDTEVQCKIPQPGDLVCGINANQSIGGTFSCMPFVSHTHKRTHNQAN